MIQDPQRPPGWHCYIMQSARRQSDKDTSGKPLKSGRKADQDDEGNMGEGRDDVSYDPVDEEGEERRGGKQKRLREEKRERKTRPTRETIVYEPRGV